MRMKDASACLDMDLFVGIQVLVLWRNRASRRHPAEPKATNDVGLKRVLTIGALLAFQGLSALYYGMKKSKRSQNNTIMHQQ
jgi:hypothetical protein